MNKLCRTCNTEKPLVNFYPHKSYRDGKHPSCSDCVKTYNRELYAKNAEYKEKRKARSQNLTDEQKQDRLDRSRKFYASHRGRALTLINGAKRNAQRKNIKFDLPFEFIYEKLISGTCEITDIPFDFSRPSSTIKNPYSPSLDRIDPKKGYTMDNVRVVIWQFNMMKGEISDKELVQLCNLIKEKLTNGLHL
jgi:hypothetical protein